MSLRGIDKAARLCLYGSHHTLAISSAGSAKMNVSFAFAASAFGSQRPVLRIRASYSSNATNQPINYPNQQQQQQQQQPPPPPMSHQAPPQPTYQQQAPLPTYQQQRPPMNPLQNQYQQAPMPQQQQINQYQQPPINQQQQQPPINQQQQQPPINQQQQQPPINQQQQQPPINQQQQQPPMNRPPMSQQQRPQMQRQPQQFQSTRTRMNRPPPMPRPPQNLPPWEEGEMRSIFDRWAARCQKNYLNAEEREYRYNTFKSRFFKPHQNTQDHRESLERLNDFGDYTVDELYDIIGGKRKACEIRPHDYKG